jgi:UDP-glucose 4-epimerase
MAELVSEERRVAVTGARTFLGSELIRHLESDPRYRHILALDIGNPDFPLEKAEFVKVDLTVPTVAADIAALLREARIDTFVHAAFLSYPTHATAWAHELEDIGTMHVLDACAQARPASFVLVSSTMVYGASAENPNFLGEETELRGEGAFEDRVRAERQVERFARDNREVNVASLRFAPILGPTVENYFTRFFSRPVAPRMMGYDPLLQFIHERDAVSALKMVVDRGDVRGTYNIAGEGVLPYSTVLAMLGRVPLPVPHFFARTLARALWATQVFDAPPSYLDFLRYLCVADASKAGRELGFRPRHSLKRTILDFLDIGGGDDATDIGRVYG